MASKAKVQIVVVFRPCGAEFHPGFQRATLSPNGQYHLEYPIWNKDMLKSRKAQEAWANEKIKHLRSWSGSYPTITEQPIE